MGSHAGRGVGAVHTRAAGAGPVCRCAGVRATGTLACAAWRARCESGGSGVGRARSASPRTQL